MIAYTNDIALITHAKSRDELEYKTSTTLNLIDDWAPINKLSFSPTKSKCLLMKVYIVTAYDIKLRESKIKFVN